VREITMCLYDVGNDPIKFLKTEMIREKRCS
jgi:hypothetical protein